MLATALVWILIGCLVARLSHAVLDLDRDANVFVVVLWPGVVWLGVVTCVLGLVDALAGGE